MRQKYILWRDNDKQELVLRELGEIDREIYALLCEETYSYSLIESAIQRGGGTLTRTLRTNNIFPQGVYAVKLSEAVQDLFTSGDNGTRELFFDDVAYLLKEGKKAEAEVDLEEADPTEMDNLLDEDLEDNDLPENLTQGEIGVDSPLKIADDEAEDVDTETS